MWSLSGLSSLIPRGHPPETDSQPYKIQAKMTGAGESPLSPSPPTATATLAQGTLVDPQCGSNQNCMRICDVWGQTDENSGHRQDLHPRTCLRLLANQQLLC